ncbi:hypothetical protein F2Q70_00011723 [Brassica cretica]|uniref:Uncharacterized protein n=1 Tax=Brassica cretica TaxID=69181 RepID=A0A8S9LP45_BRACR|nr:hypothetical protein F2Q70_00011723 [Brassica cretica]
MEGSPYRKFSFSQRKGAVPGTGPGVLRSGNPEAGVLPGTKETEEDIRRMFHEARNKMKNRITLKKKSDPGKFAIPCLVKGLMVEPSKESFTFVDCSQRNSGGIVRDLEVQIGNALVPVDFHVLEVKLNWNSSLLLGRAFLSTVGAVLNVTSGSRAASGLQKRPSDSNDTSGSQQHLRVLKQYHGPVRSQDPAIESSDLVPSLSLPKGSWTTHLKTLPGSSGFHESTTQGHPSIDRGLSPGADCNVA